MFAPWLYSCHSWPPAVADSPPAGAHRCSSPSAPWPPPERRDSSRDLPYMRCESAGARCFGHDHLLLLHLTVVAQRQQKWFRRFRLGHRLELRFGLRVYLLWRFWHRLRGRTGRFLGFCLALFVVFYENVLEQSKLGRKTLCAVLPQGESRDFLGTSYTVTAGTAYSALGLQLGLGISE